MTRRVVPLRDRLLGRLASSLARLAALLDRVADGVRPRAEQVRHRGRVGGGDPPEHWVALLEQHAPHLLGEDGGLRTFEASDPPPPVRPEAAVAGPGRGVAPTLPPQLGSPAGEPGGPRRAGRSFEQPGWGPIAGVTAAGRPRAPGGWPAAGGIGATSTERAGGEPGRFPPSFRQERPRSGRAGSEPELDRPRPRYAGSAGAGRPSGHEVPDFPAGAGPAAPPASSPSAAFPSDAGDTPPVSGRRAGLSPRFDQLGPPGQGRGRDAWAAPSAGSVGAAARRPSFPPDPPEDAPADASFPPDPSVARSPSTFVADEDQAGPVPARWVADASPERGRASFPALQRAEDLWPLLPPSPALSDRGGQAHDQRLRRLEREQEGR